MRVDTRLVEGNQQATYNDGKFSIHGRGCKGEAIMKSECRSESGIHSSFLSGTVRIVCRIPPLEPFKQQT